MKKTQNEPKVLIEVLSGKTTQKDSEFFKNYESKK